MAEFPVIPGYCIERELGRGGMATVYLAVQERLNRKVAIKVLSPVLFQDETFARRFLKEAETAANLHHANIIAIHDVGEANGTYFIVMEFLAKGSLKDRVRSGPVAPRESLAIISQMALALDYAHKKGFIHRDIKPDNILFREDNTTVLTDFGIAKAVDSTTKMTKTGMSLGTPHYMSVEQLRGVDLDGRTDLYSLGVVLFEMLTGKVPYDATDTIAVAIKHIQEPVPQLISGLASWQPLIDRLMAKDREQRFQSGMDLVSAIDRVSGAQDGPAKAGVSTTPADDRAAFQFAVKLGTAEAFRFFLESYPDGAHAPEARESLLEVDKKANGQDPLDGPAFEKAAGIDTPDSYVDYIRQFPAGENVQKAVARIARLEQNKEKKTDLDDTQSLLQAAVVATPTQGENAAPKSPRRDDASAEKGRAWERQKVLAWGDDGWVAEHFPDARRNPAGFWEIVRINGTVLIYVPAGKFIMGSGPEAAQDEQPRHEVWLDGYWIGKYPVTFRQFNYFCELTKRYSRGVLEKKFQPDDHGWGRGDMPVVQVTNLEADLYCKWLGEQSGMSFGLPTEAQWEKAARGMDGRHYPWGETPPTCKQAHFGLCGNAPKPVTQLPEGASPYGAMHMAGNVWEWCEDNYEHNYYERAPYKNPVNNDHGFLQVLRGGSFKSHSDDLRCAERAFSQKKSCANDIGFRVRMEVK